MPNVEALPAPWCRLCREWITDPRKIAACAEDNHGLIYGQHEHNTNSRATSCTVAYVDEMGVECADCRRCPGDAREISCDFEFCHEVECRICRRPIEAVHKYHGGTTLLAWKRTGVTW